MPRMPGDMAARYGELLAEYDAGIKDLNKGKSETIDDLRAELRAAGFVGAEISAEIAMLKGALKVLGMTQVEQQKANDKDEGVSEYIVLLSIARARAHEAKAAGANPETGEIALNGAALGDEEINAKAPASKAAEAALAQEKINSSTAARKDVPDYQPLRSGSLPASAEAELGSNTSGSPREPTQTAGTQAPPVDSALATGHTPTWPLTPADDGQGAPIPPPAEGNTPTSAGHGDESAANTIPAALVVDPIARVDADAGVDRSGPGVPSLNKSAPVANVIALRTHNPDTHFLNSAGLVRLHGCLKPEICGSSEPRKRLCFTCSVKHDGPTFQDGVA